MSRMVIFMFKIRPYRNRKNDLIYSFDVDMPKVYEDISIDFFKIYEIENLFFHPLRKQRLKNKKDRICDFCSKGYPEVTFSNVAHIIPQLMGNRNLISDFECDMCNSKFSRYENDLANFMGLTRSLIYSDRKIPKYKTPKKDLIVEQEDAKKLKIISDGLENNNFEIDEANNLLTLKSVRHPYKRINVYKALLKIGLSLMEQKQIEEFTLAYKFLSNSKSDEKMRGHPFMRLYLWQFPGPPFITPLAFVCNKKKEKSSKKYPEKTICIYFSNYIYQIFYSFNTKDLELFKAGELVTLLRFPPLIDKSWIEMWVNHNLLIWTYLVRKQ